MKIAQKIRNAIKKTLSKSKKKNLKPFSAEDSSDSLDDYVGEDELDQISGDSISLYQCEMPEEKLAKMKAMTTPIYRMRGELESLRNKTHNKPARDMMDMSVNYHGHQHYSQSPVRATQEDFIMLPRVNPVGAQTLARVMSIFPEHEDYMNMEEPNYDDYMYFSDVSNSSNLLGPCDSNFSSSLEAPPPYSEKDPIYKLYSRYDL